jgi:2-keto-4-pentenoate hydratase
MMLRRRFSSSAADMLVHARRSATPLPRLPEAVRPATLDEAYAVQAEGWSATLAQYEDTRRIGYKVAATSEMAQASVDMTHPFAGALFSHSTYGYDDDDGGEGVDDDGGGAMAKHRTWRLSAASFGEFRLIEPEFGLVLHSDIAPGTDHTRDSVAAAVGGVVPCIELVASGFDLGSADDTAAQLAGFRSLGALSLISDNASHGAWIVGQHKHPDLEIWQRSGVEAGLPVKDPITNRPDHRRLLPHKFEWLLDELDTHRCKLYLNDELVAEGDGSAVLGHPLNSLAWLANHLGQYGTGLQAGEVVTTGVVVNGLVNARAGDLVRAEFGTLGIVEILFEP